MHSETCTTDAKGRLTLPMAFANATVLVEHVSETEVRIRLTKAAAEEELTFVEESVTRLSDRDRDRFLELLADPPAPTPALKRAAARHEVRRG
ncbi:MAG: DUF1778 domain-containing protein [Pirellulales bacterium]